MLFNPGMRHEQEERLAKQMLREDEGAGRKGRHGIDLDAGVVVIGSATATPQAEPEESEAERRAVAGDVDGGAVAPSDAVTNAAAATPTVGETHRPGEAHVADRATVATPLGKARHQGGVGPGQSAPVGKSRRGR